MASIIDNRNKTMLDSLKNSLKQAESVAYYYNQRLEILQKNLEIGGNKANINSALKQMAIILEFGFLIK